MRMWMVPTEYMCLQHLLGEHLELHMFLGTLKKGKTIKGYIEKNCCEPRSIKQRHDIIVKELEKRGKTGHKTPIEENDCQNVCNLSQEHQYWEVDSRESLIDLLDRCPKCLELYKETVSKHIEESIKKPLR